MIPATVPGLPVTIFPGLLVPSMPAVMAGVSVVDVTAAVAVLVWAIGGLVALRLAISMSREDRPRDSAQPTEPDHPQGFRDAA